ncbi:MAG: tetraacyldisaccharide 4'-kinase, partial [Betaproteobacteria bacterium]|nr:tetraacyldisaccharide 4'-kinase [Betaproteobacteria bacterium]
TGKTPLVIWLARTLAQAGRRPGVLSRGYGGASTAPRDVRSSDQAALVGDEPLLLAMRCGCPVWTGADRARAGAALLAANPKCDVLICDDGLQHYRLARDIEIAVTDRRGNGNGLMLPAGPLREPAGRAVDALVLNCELGEARPTRTRAAAEFAMRLEPIGTYFLHDPAKAVGAAELRGRRLHAVAGIGDPQRFFAQLARLGLAPRCHSFPDHHRYAAADLDFPDCDLVLMTEKDAVKCAHLGRTDLAVLRVEARLDPAFGEFILERLRGLATA